MIFEVGGGSMKRLLDGRKTRTAAVLAAALAINELLAQLGLPHLTREQQEAILYAATAFGLVGIGHKLDKLRDG